jgi:hypothetical protein
MQPTSSQLLEIKTSLPSKTKLDRKLQKFLHLQESAIANPIPASISFKKLYLETLTGMKAPRISSSRTYSTESWNMLPKLP